MADLQEGSSGPDVKKIQQQINEYYDATMVPESGNFDRKTTEGVRRFQGDVKLAVTGVVDAATAKLLDNPPKIKGRAVKLNGVELIITEDQYKELARRLGKAAKASAQALRRKAEEARGIWDGLMQVRKDTFFLIPAMVDTWARISFPNESLIKAAETAVAKLETAINGTDIDAMTDAMNEAMVKVDAAIRAMKSYRDSMFSGGDSLIKTLELVKEGCKDFVEVSAAIATGGASVEVTAGVMASVGAYNSLLTQIDKASTTVNFSFVDAVGNVLVDGAVGGTVGALLHNESFVSGIKDRIAKELAESALKQFGAGLSAKVAEKAVKGALDKALEAAVKDLVESFKPGSKMTMDKAIKDVSDNLLKGAAFGAGCGKMEKELEAFSKDSVKFFKPGMFAGLGNVDMKKAFDKGGEQIVEVAMKRLGEKVILDAANDPRKMADVGKLMANAISSDAAVNKQMADLVAKQKLK